MSVTVSIPTILRTYTDGQKTVEASGKTVGEVIDDLDAKHGGFKERLVKDDKLHRFVNIYVNDEDVRFSGGLDAEVSDGDTVTILPAVAGGDARPTPHGPVRHPCSTLLGGTPLVGLPRLSPSDDVRLWAKLEDRNPTGSIKDRPALRMIEAAERDGVLKPGDTILEPTSGNTGISLAMAAQAQGLRHGLRDAGEHLEERRQLLQAYGARIVYSPAAGGSNEAVRERRNWRRATRTGSCCTSTAIRRTREAHYRGTGPELLEDLPTLTHFVGGLGTTGTLMGVGRYLREHKPECRSSPPNPVTGSWCTACATSTRDSSPNSTTRMCSTAVTPWAPTTRCAGLGSCWSARASSRASPPVRCCMRRWEWPTRCSKKGGTADIAFVVADAGWKYLSTGAYSGSLDEAAERLDGQLWA